MVKHSKIKRAVAFLLVMLTCMSLLVIPASADDDISADASFYKLSSVASGYLSTALSKPDDWVLPNVQPGDAGGLLGYSDNADESGLIEGWISSALSASSVTFSYDALRKITAEDDSSSTSTRNTYALWYYTQYGRLLKTIGFDSTSAETSMDFIRPAGGWLMKGAYYLASTVQSMFSIIVEFLHTLNPFRLFKSRDDAYNIADIDYASDSATDPALKTIGDAIGTWYDIIRSFAPLVIGLLFVILIAGILLTNKSFGEAKPKIKKFIIRAVALVIGVPLLAAVYTSMLGWMLPSDDVFGTENTPAASAIFSVFLDFENWAQSRQLSVPSGAKLECTSVPSGSGYRLVPTDETYRMLKTTCYAINQASKSGLSDENKQAGLINDLLDRYTNGTFYYASSWEGYAKGKGLFTFASFKDTVDKTGTSVALFHENAATALTGSGLWTGSSAWYYDVWTNGGSLVADESDTKNLNYSSAGKLSTMSLYNYLTSTFDDSSVTVYSNEKASSGYVRQSHHSVNIIGTGILSFLYWLNTFSLLICYAVLGWVYGMSVIFNAIKRLLHLVTAIPFAMLGSIRSIARVLIYSIMMILEVAVTIFVYQIMCQLLGAISGLIETPFVKALTGTDAGRDFASTIVLNGQPMALDIASIMVVVLLFSTIVLIVFCVQALKIKKAIVKFIDEMITETIEKLFGVKAMSDGMSGPSAGARMAGAVGAGVGAGLAQKAMSGSNDKETQDTKGVQGAPPGGGGDDAGGGLVPTGGDTSQQDVQAGDAALDDGGQMALESGDVNIDDNDSATASFGGNDNESQAEIAAADSMLALGDGSQTDVGGDTMSQDAQAGDTAVDGSEQEQEIAQGDAAQELDAAGADSVEDVGDQAQMAGEAAQEAAAGDMATAGGVSAVAAGAKSQDGQTAVSAGQKKNQNGQKPGELQNGQKIDPKTGQPTGQSAVGPDGKPTAVPSGEHKPVAAASSSNLQEAQQRNAAAKARLAALQGQSNQAPGQTGQIGANGQKIDPKGQAKAISSEADAGPAGVAAMPVGSQSQVDGAAAIPSAVSGSVQPGVGLPSSSPSAGSISAGSQSSGPVVAPAGAPVAATPAGVNESVQPGAIPGSAPAGSVSGASQGQAQFGPSMSRVASVNPGGQAIPVSPVSAPSVGPQSRQAVVAPGSAQSGPVAAPMSSQSVPVSGHGAVPSGTQAGAGVSPASGGGQPGHVAGSVQPNATQGHGPISQPTVVQAPAAVQSQQAAHAPSGQGSVQTVSGGQVLAPAQTVSVGGKNVTQSQTIQQSQSGGGRGSVATDGQRQVSSGHGGKRGKNKKSTQPTVAGAMARAAVAAFMASSESSLVSGVGKGAQSYQQMQMFSQMQRRGDDIATPGSESESISAYDADTAQIEAQIAKLEAQNRMRSSGGHKKLGEKVEPPTDGSLL